MEVRLAEKASLERKARLTRKLLWLQSSDEMRVPEVVVNTVAGVGEALVNFQRVATKSVEGD